jgi:hypothetical protein
MDIYSHGVSGEVAAWAAKKYQGHRTIFDNMAETLGAAKSHQKNPKTKPPLHNIPKRNIIRQLAKGYKL